MVHASARADLQSWCSATVVHEPSYLPFLFTSAAADVSDSIQAKSKGRRSFNTKGKEVEIVAGQVRKLLPLLAN